MEEISDCDKLRAAVKDMVDGQAFDQAYAVSVKALMTTSLYMAACYVKVRNWLFDYFEAQKDADPDALKICKHTPWIYNSFQHFLIDEYGIKNVVCSWLNGSSQNRCGNSSSRNNKQHDFCLRNELLAFITLYVYGMLHVVNDLGDKFPEEIELIYDSALREAHRLERMLPSSGKSPIMDSFRIALEIFNNGDMF